MITIIMHCNSLYSKWVYIKNDYCLKSICSLDKSWKTDSTEQIGIHIWTFIISNISGIINMIPTSKNKQIPI